MAGLFSRKKKTSLLDDGALPLRVDSPSGEVILDLSPALVSIYRRWYTYLSREQPLPRRLGLVSAIRGEGLTTISMALAAVMATDLECRIALVECNWWWPGLAAAAHMDPAPGFAEWVGEKSAIEASLRSCSLPNLTFIPAGELSEGDRSRLARGNGMVEALKQLDERFDLIILDIPAILAVKEAPVLARLASDLCLVIRQGITPISEVKKALDEIEHLPLRGVILNGMHTHIAKGSTFLNLGERA